MEGTTHSGLDPTYKLLIKITQSDRKDIFFILRFLFSDDCILCQLNKKLTSTEVECIEEKGAFAYYTLWNNGFTRVVEVLLFLP